MNRKSILNLLTIVLLALFAAGCGSQQADQEVETIDEVEFGNIVSASGMEPV